VSLGRIGTLFGKEIRQGASNFMLVFGVIMPLVLSLLVTLVFGDLLAERPRLGLVSHDGSRVVDTLKSQEHLDTTVYASDEQLRSAVSSGAVTVGIILPEGFDQALQTGEDTNVVSLRWGEGLLKDLVVIETAFVKAVAEVSELELPLRLEPVQLGTADTASWSERLLPLLVLMGVLLTGMLIPAAALVDEKQRRTLGSLTVTPVTLSEVYASKMILGVVLGVVMSLVVLLINGALGQQFGLLIGVLVAVSFSASVFGALLGSFVEDMNSFMGFMKATGILLYAPGFLQLIPQAPQWIARIFPTYYLMSPVLDVTQRGAGLGDIMLDLAILAGLTVLMIVGLSYVLRRQEVKIGLAA